MIKKNENAIRKLKLINRLNFTPIGLYRMLCKKQSHQIIQPRLIKQERFIPNTIIQSHLFLVTLLWYSDHHTILFETWVDLYDEKPNINGPKFTPANVFT